MPAGSPRSQGEAWLRPCMDAGSVYNPGAEANDAEMGQARHGSNTGPQVAAEVIRRAAARHYARWQRPRPGR